MSIIHTILGWVLGVFAPGSGRRRKTGTAAPVIPVRRPDAPRPGARPPAPRSPYGLAEPLDGGSAALVRPYVLEAEREWALKRRRRLAAVLAADFGVDLDRHVVGAEGVAW